MNDDEDHGDEEIFFGPVGFTETCVAKAVEDEVKDTEVFKPLSPLSIEEMVLVFKEAQTVACRISAAKRDDSSSTDGSTSSASHQKLNMFSAESLTVPEVSSTNTSPFKDVQKTLFASNPASPVEALENALPKVNIPKNISKMASTNSQGSKLSNAKKCLSGSFGLRAPQGQLKRLSVALKPHVRQQAVDIKGLFHIQRRDGLGLNFFCYCNSNLLTPPNCTF